MSLNGEASCQAVEEHSNNGRVEKATLTFMTVDDVPRGGVAWMVRQANEGWWLIGARERPAPVVKVTTSLQELSPSAPQSFCALLTDHIW